MASESMTNNRLRKATVVGIVLVAGAALLWAWAKEPTFQGRSMTEWLNDWATQKKTEYLKAVAEIGLAGLPYAVDALARNDSVSSHRYRVFHSKMPKFLTKVLPAPREALPIVAGANYFLVLGSNSIPSAITLLQHPSPSVRQAAAWGLGTLRRKTMAANQSIPALIGSLADEERDVRFQAVLALKEIGGDASNAVPGIRKVLNTGLQSPTNSSFYVQAAAASALGKIGPTAASALPDLKAATQVSHQDSPGYQNSGASYLRGQAAVAIWRIDGDVATALPIMLREMPGMSEHSKWDWIIALGEMGPRAKDALPQLQNELRQDKEGWVLRYVTNALRKIDLPSGENE